MANAVYVSIQVTATDTTTGETDTYVPQQMSITQSAEGEGGGTQNIPTADTLVDLGNCTTPGLIWLHNCDSTNYIEYGPGDASSADAILVIGKILAGETHLFRLASGVTLRARANTAACLLKTRVYET